MSFAAQFTKQFILKKTGQAKVPTKCQKCLETGHWTYECKNERKYVKREPRSKQVDKAPQEMLDVPKKTKKVVISSESSLSSESEDEKVTETKKLSNLISDRLQKNTSLKDKSDSLSDPELEKSPVSPKGKQPKPVKVSSHSSSDRKKKSYTKKTRKPRPVSSDSDSDSSDSKDRSHRNKKPRRQKYSSSSSSS